MSAAAHAEAVARLLAGYHQRTMPSEERAISRALKERQDERVRTERRDARRADAPAAAHAHRRRADKAAYLRDKLAEAERAG